MIDNTRMNSFMPILDKKTQCYIIKDIHCELMTKDYIVMLESYSDSLETHLSLN